MIFALIWKFIKKMFVTITNTRSHREEATPIGLAGLALPRRTVEYMKYIIPLSIAM